MTDLRLTPAGLDYLRLLKTGPMLTREVREHVFGPDWTNAFSDYMHVEAQLIREGLAVFQCWVKDPRCAITAQGDLLIARLDQ